MTKLRFIIPIPETATISDVLDRVEALREIGFPHIVDWENRSVYLEADLQIDEEVGLAIPAPKPYCGLSFAAGIQHALAYASLEGEIRDRLRPYGWDEPSGVVYVPEGG